MISLLHVYNLGQTASIIIRLMWSLKLAATLSTPVGSGEEEEDITDVDSEEERERDAIAMMEMLNRVSPIKEQQLKKAETWHRDAAARVQYSRPAQPITCATFAEDVLEGRASVSQSHEHKHQPMIFGPASIVNGGLSTERERMIAQMQCTNI
ncbi:hypothetical protein IGI04_005694 [Brassica rapa subsp. trilocularis]|uniref:Uncharacterized protein n=1 Tax=Brassica rapa subsp. trilocularis TaxID=1813537 RepID=A0ABQ7NH22_BRACM|nr:hypothetical protein IGI04_005694 [Brassica rapa subsp. trilocularis]